jgi:hypothetical protein
MLSHTPLERGNNKNKMRTKNKQMKNESTRLFTFCLLMFFLIESRDSSVSKERSWTTQQFGFDSQQGQEIFLSSAAPRLALGSNQPPIQ